VVKEGGRPRKKSILRLELSPVKKYANSDGKKQENAKEVGKTVSIRPAAKGRGEIHSDDDESRRKGTPVQKGKEEKGEVVSEKGGSASRSGKQPANL